MNAEPQKAVLINKYCHRPPAIGRMTAPLTTTPSNLAVNDPSH
jgi:hypothetical protein